MSEPKPSKVLGGLPRTRPHRRSDKRAARTAPAGAETAAEFDAAASAPRSPAPATATKTRTRTAGARTKSAATRGTPRATAKPAATAPPAGPRRRTAAAPGAGARGARIAAQKASKPEPAGRTDLLGTAVQAAAELAEIGLSASARALRGAVSRLPRP